MRITKTTQTTITCQHPTSNIYIILRCVWWQPSWDGRLAVVEYNRYFTFLLQSKYLHLSSSEGNAVKTLSPLNCQTNPSWLQIKKDRRFPVIADLDRRSPVISIIFFPPWSIPFLLCNSLTSFLLPSQLIIHYLHYSNVLTYNREDPRGTRYLYE